MKLPGLFLWSVLLIFLPGIALQRKDAPVASRIEERSPVQTLRYIMRGEVRLLLFWVGRDKVGGGRISLAHGAETNPGLDWEQVEVLFGSNPDRVPGKVNMWGYGKERSEWRRMQGGEQELVGSIFEGFMRPRDEFPSDVQGYMKEHQAQGSFLYKAIRSKVDAENASTEIRFFVEKEDFDYNDPEKLVRKFQQELPSTPPDSSRRLPQSEAQYEMPAGFLTAAQRLVEQVCDRADRDPRAWTRLRPSIRYAYHAKGYRLAVRNIKSMDDFTAPYLPDSKGRRPHVAEVDFRAQSLKEGGADDFTLWFECSGPMRGLPLRISYQPNWWLRIRLDLTGSY